MKLIIGVTIVSDIVVLVGFGVISAAVSSVCPVAGVNGFIRPSTAKAFVVAASVCWYC